MPPPMRKLTSDDGFVEMGTYTYSQYDLVDKEITKYNEELSEHRNSQRRKIEAIRESIMPMKPTPSFLATSTGVWFI